MIGRFTGKDAMTTGHHESLPAGASAIFTELQNGPPLKSLCNPVEDGDVLRCSQHQARKEILHASTRRPILVCTIDRCVKSKCFHIIVAPRAIVPSRACANVSRERGHAAEASWPPESLGNLCIPTSQVSAVSDYSSRYTVI